MMTKSVTSTHFKQHRKEPKIELSLYKVKGLLRKAKIKPIPGHAYILYECGHIFDYNDDPGIVKYSAGVQRGSRSCPICVSKTHLARALLTKYKKCPCGAEHVGKRIQASKCCASCSSSRRAARGELTENLKRRNGHLEDPSRVLCIHRLECLDKYCMYEAIPCKGCRRFKEDSKFTSCLM